MKKIILFTACALLCAGTAFSQNYKHAIGLRAGGSNAALTYKQRSDHQPVHNQTARGTCKGASFFNTKKAIRGGESCGLYGWKIFYKSFYQGNRIDSETVQRKALA